MARAYITITAPAPPAGLVVVNPPVVVHGISTLHVGGDRWEALCRCGAALSGAGDVDAALSALTDHGVPR